jgi:hypothetical protein
MDHYPALVQSKLKVEADLTSYESKALSLISKEVMTSKRPHEFVLLELLIQRNTMHVDEIRDAFRQLGVPSSDVQQRSAVDTLTLNGFSQADVDRYERGIAETDGNIVSLRPDFVDALSLAGAFQRAVQDVLKTGKQLVLDRFQTGRLFTPGLQYSRRDAARALGWPRAATSTIYGLKTDEVLGVSAIFVTLHKSSEIVVSTAYEDELLDTQTMIWFTKSNRTLKSKDVRGLVAGTVALHVFVKKDDAEGSDHYYLGQATSQDARETSMSGNDGKPLPVVKMLLKFNEPISQGLFDYLAPSS